jgi:hypothetical protein
MPGVFITKGATVAIPRISFRIRDDGTIESDPVILHVRFDVCPTWMRLAQQHLTAARAAATRRDEAWRRDDEQAKTRSIEEEFEFSMQAIVAAAVAWDALYAILATHIELPASLIERWRKGRTARYSQVTEVVRRGFKLRPGEVAFLRATLREIYRFRDLAVHPSGKVQAAEHDPELDVGTEWRFVYFRASNAQTAVDATSLIFWDLANSASARDPDIGKYQESLRFRLHEVFPEGPPAWPTSPLQSDA